MKQLNVLQPATQPVNNARPSVVIAPKLNKVSERFDSNGNQIDPRTKRIIKKADQQ